MFKWLFETQTHPTHGTPTPGELCLQEHLIASTLLFPQVLTKQLQALLEVQANPLSFSKIAQVRQRDRVLGLQASVLR